MKTVMLLSILIFVAGVIKADVVTKTIEYKHGDVVLEGFLAYDNSQTGKAPGVLIVHQWMGLTDYEKMRARMLAELGYVAFAVDMYGKGVRPQNAQEAAQQATIYRSDRQLMRDRVTAGLETLLAQDNVDPTRIAAIGYCFGGGVALELARSGADITGVVSFHGNLDTPNPADAQNIRASILAQHGANDPHVTNEQVTAFENEMRDANVDWYLIEYGNAVHSFTQKMAGDDPSKGAAYNARADERSWKAMKQFFNEIFAEK